MPMMAETHIQNTAPGPPAAIASATPAVTAANPRREAGTQSLK